MCIFIIVKKYSEVVSSDNVRQLQHTRYSGYSQDGSENVNNGAVPMVLSEGQN